MHKLYLKIIAFLCALTLWLFVVLEKQYQISFQIPLRTHNTPANTAFVEALPDSIACELKLPGFVKLFSSKQVGEFVIDLAKYPLGVQQIDLNAQNFKPYSKNIVFLVFNQNPQLKIHLDTKIKKVVPLHSKIKTHLAEKRIFKEKPYFAQDSIAIFGARQNLKSVAEIYTEELHFHEITKDTTLAIPLQIPNNFELASNEVKMILKVDTLVSRTFANIPVRLIPPTTNQTHKLSPQTANITVSGGTQTILNMSKNEIDIFIDKNRFEIENKKSIAPVLKFSKPVHSYQLNPDEFQLLPKELPHDNTRN